MYYKFYNLKADPFRLSPDHVFCYRHPSYAKGRAYMEYALDAAEGFVVVTGRPGMGKTTLINDLLANSSLSKYLVASIVTTRLDADDLLRSIAYEFSLNVQEADKATIIQKLKRLFILSTRNARPPLLIVDEAQNLSLNALEELRLLTNMQHEGLPLLQIFLLGQDELREKLLDPKLEQLRQRVSAATQLEPLSEEHTGEYIVHRLRVVGWKNHPRISRAAVTVLHRTCQGVPRRINQFCSRLFLLGAGEEKDRLTAEDARQVALELGDEGLTPEDDGLLTAPQEGEDDGRDLAAELFARLAAGEAEEREKARRREASAEPDVFENPPELPATALVRSGGGDTPPASPRAAGDGVSVGGAANRGRSSPAEPPAEPTAAQTADDVKPRRKASSEDRPTPSAAAQRRPRRRAQAPSEADPIEGREPRRRSRWASLGLYLLLIGAGVLLYLDWRDELRVWLDRHYGDAAVLSGPASTAPDQGSTAGASAVLEDGERAYPILRDPRSPAGGAGQAAAGEEDGIAEGMGDLSVRPPAAVEPDQRAASDGLSLRSAVPRTRTTSPQPTLPSVGRPEDRPSPRGDLREADDRAVIEEPTPPAPPTRPEEPHAVDASVAVRDAAGRVREVRFGFDSASVDADASRQLTEIARELKQSQEGVAVLVGHTDPSGPADYNRRLSAQRARAVASRLAELGVDADRIVVGRTERAAYADLLEALPAPVSKRSVQVVVSARR